MFRDEPCLSGMIGVHVRTEDLIDWLAAKATVGVECGVTAATLEAAANSGYMVTITGGDGPTFTFDDDEDGFGEAEGEGEGGGEAGFELHIDGADDGDSEPPPE